MAITPLKLTTSDIVRRVLEVVNANAGLLPVGGSVSPQGILSLTTEDGQSIPILDLSTYFLTRTEAADLTGTAPATENRSGLVRIATDQEAYVGEDDTKTITPAKLAYALQQVFSQGITIGGLLIREIEAAEPGSIEAGTAPDILVIDSDGTVRALSPEQLTDTDTLQSVTERGSITDRAVSVGGLETPAVTITNVQQQPTGVESDLLTLNPLTGRVERISPNRVSKTDPLGWQRIQTDPLALNRPYAYGVTLLVVPDITAATSAAYSQPVTLELLTTAVQNGVTIPVHVELSGTRTGGFRHVTTGGNSDWSILIHRSRINTATTSNDTIRAIILDFLAGNPDVNLATLSPVPNGNFLYEFLQTNPGITCKQTILNFARKYPGLRHFQVGLRDLTGVISIPLAQEIYADIVALNPNATIPGPPFEGSLSFLLDLNFGQNLILGDSYIKAVTAVDEQYLPLLITEISNDLTILNKNELVVSLMLFNPNLDLTLIVEALTFYQTTLYVRYTGSTSLSGTAFVRVWQGSDGGKTVDLALMPVYGEPAGEEIYNTASVAPYLYYDGNEFYTQKQVRVENAVTVRNLNILRPAPFEQPARLLFWNPDSTAVMSGSDALTIAELKRLGVLFGTTPSNPNRPPVAPIIDDQTGVAGIPFSFVIPAFSHPDDLVLLYSIITATGLSGLVFDANTRTLSGTATFIGFVKITVRATDTNDPPLSAETTFVLTMEAPANNAPTLPAVANQQQTIGSPLSLILPAGSDPDGNNLNYLLFSTNLPDTRYSFNPATREVTFNAVAVGTFLFRYLADDGELSAMREFDLNVILSGVFAVFVERYNCATNEITFGNTFGNGSAQYMAAGVTGWTTNPGPHKVDAGVISDPNNRTLTLNAQLNGVFATLVFDFRDACPPVAPNQPPVAPALPNQTQNLGSTTNFTVEQFTDPDDDPLTYGATGLPAGLSFNPNTRIVSGTATAEGVSTVRITAKDGKGGEATATFTITVTKLPGAANMDMVFAGSDSYAMILTLNEPAMSEHGQTATPGSSNARFIGTATVESCLALAALTTQVANVTVFNNQLFYRFGIGLDEIRAKYPTLTSVRFTLSAARVTGNANSRFDIRTNADMASGLIAAAPPIGFTSANSNPGTVRIWTNGNAYWKPGTVMTPMADLVFDMITGIADVQAPTALGQGGIDEQYGGQIDESGTTTN